MENDETMKIKTKLGENYGKNHVHIFEGTKVGKKCTLFFNIVNMYMNFPWPHTLISSQVVSSFKGFSKVFLKTEAKKKKKKIPPTLR